MMVLFLMGKAGYRHSAKMSFFIVVSVVLAFWLGIRGKGSLVVKMAISEVSRLIALSLFVRPFDMFF